MARSSTYDWGKNRYSLSRSCDQQSRSDSFFPAPSREQAQSISDLSRSHSLTWLFDIRRADMIAGYR